MKMAMMIILRRVEKDYREEKLLLETSSLVLIAEWELMESS